MTKLLDELKRRNVFRVALAYLAAAWLLIQVADVVFDTISSPPWVMQALLFFLAAGFPIAIIFSWAFEITPEGIKPEHEVDRTQSITRQTGRKLDFMIIAVLAAAVLVLLFDKFYVKDAEIRTLITEKTIAVLPFDTFSSGEDDGYFADGMTEEILNSLAQIPELLVTARTSSFFFKDKNIPIREIAETLGVEYIVEGSVRRSGNQIRVTAQLIRTDEDNHLWSNTWDVPSDDTFTVQTDIAERIAETLDIVLDEEQLDRMREIGLGKPEAFIAFQKGRELYAEAHGHPDMLDMLTAANLHFEEVIRLSPEFSQAYIHRSDHAAHVLAFSAAGVEFTNEELSLARSQLRDDLQAAIRHAPDEGTRRGYMIDMALLTGEWQGIAALLSQLPKDMVCSASAWANVVAVPFGYAEEYLRTQQYEIACDPLNYSGWMGAAQAFSAMGEVDAALETARAGQEKVSHPLLVTELIAGNILKGDFEGARAANLLHSQSDRRQMRSDFVIAA
ncbi:MAG: hypothetical protein R3268_06655, partial [Acidiferrobacterales bacterium]|nr:hypothetical protein [Acidiferrobacterales bacterium]